MTIQPIMTCEFCNAQHNDMTVWVGPLDECLLIVGDCPSCGCWTPIQTLLRISDLQPIPQTEMTTGPKAV